MLLQGFAFGGGNDIGKEAVAGFVDLICLLLNIQGCHFSLKLSQILIVLGASA